MIVNKKTNILHFSIILFTFVVVLLTLGNFNNTHATTITLEQIVDKIKSSNGFNMIANHVYISSVTTERVDNFEITIEDNKLLMEMEFYSKVGIKEGSTTKYTTEFILEDNILTQTKCAKGKVANELFVILVVNSIGQLQGYEDGEIYSTINDIYAHRIAECTLEIEGIKFENQKYLVEGTEDEYLYCPVPIIDVGKKIPLNKYSRDYLRSDDFESHVFRRQNNIMGEITEIQGNAIVGIYSQSSNKENIYKSFIEGLKALKVSDEIIEYVEQEYPEYDGKRVNREEIKVKIIEYGTKLGFVPEILEFGDSFVGATLEINLSEIARIIYKNEDPLLIFVFVFQYQQVHLLY